MLADGKERVSDAPFLLWISSPALTGDFEFLAEFLNTDCTNISFVSHFLSPDWIPSFCDDGHVAPKTSFSGLYQPTQSVNVEIFTRILSSYSIPSFFAKPVMARIDPRILKKRSTAIKFSEFLFLTEVLDNATPEKRVFGLLHSKTDRDYVVSGDFAPFVVQFLKDQTELSEIIGNTAVSSMFARFIITLLLLRYDPDFRGRITWRNFRKFDFEATLKWVAQFDQFRVAYQQFLGLDKGNKNGIKYDEFVNYDSNRIHPKVISRIWKFLVGDSRRLSFANFVMFLVMLEDKSTPASLNFWFSVCDLDDDEVLSLSDMQQLYRYQKQRLRQLSIEPEKFKRLIPQILDMVGARGAVLTKVDIRKSGNWPCLFNFLIDSKRFSEWDFKDPLYSTSIKEQSNQTAWDMFCEGQLAAENLAQK
jgi:serine/threonine-protein phosphatase 2A regulatory subunit B''